MVGLVGFVVAAVSGIVYLVTKDGGGIVLKLQPGEHHVLSSPLCSAPFGASRLEHLVDVGSAPDHCAAAALN